MHLVCKSRSIYSSVLTKSLNEAVTTQSIRTGRAPRARSGRIRANGGPGANFFLEGPFSIRAPTGTSPPRQATCTPGPTRRAAYTWILECFFDEELGK